jgi:hypothetical protein
MIILDSNGVGWSMNPGSKHGLIYKDGGIVVKKDQYVMCDLDYWNKPYFLKKHHRINTKIIKKCFFSRQCIFQAKDTMIFPDYGWCGIRMVSDHFMD